MFNKNKSKFVFLILILFSVNIRADIFDDYTKKFEELNNLIASAEKNGQPPPSLNNPAESRKILALTSDEQLKAFAMLPEDRMLDVLTSCGYTTDLYKKYFILKSAKGEFNIKIAEDNLKNYQNEMILLSGFNLKCYAGLLPKLENFYHNLPQSEKTENRINGLLQVKSGIVKIYTGSIMLIASDCLSIKSRQNLLTTLLEITPNYVSVMSLSDRQIVIDLIKKYELAADDSLKPLLSDLIKLLQTKECNELCAVS